jgi:hypothetical protein
MTAADRYEASKRVAQLPVLALILLFLVLPAHADTDGSYCTTKGYIAYELRSFHTPGLHAPHVLRVVRFDHGIHQAGEVAMQDFQVHELKCEADRVEIAGYDKGWLKYVIDISRPGGFRIVERVEETKEQHPFVSGSPGPMELGGPSPAAEEVIMLASADPEHKYQLVLTRSQKVNNLGTDKRERGFEFDNRAELRQVDPRGKISQRVLLYREHFTEHGDYSL